MCEALLDRGNDSNNTYLKDSRLEAVRVSNTHAGALYLAREMLPKEATVVHLYYRSLS